MQWMHIFLAEKSNDVKNAHNFERDKLSCSKLCLRVAATFDVK